MFLHFYSRVPVEQHSLSTFCCTCRHIFKAAAIQGSIPFCSLTFDLLNAVTLYQLIKNVFALFIFSECKFGNDPHCTFPCNCLDSFESCNKFSGECPISGCNVGPPRWFWWSGPSHNNYGCRVKNVAFGKPANQTGTWEDDTADRAVDGNTDGFLDHMSCAHLFAPLGGEVKWMVDLESMHVVLSVTLYNRDNLIYYQRMSNMEVWISNSSNENVLCGRYGGTIDQGSSEGSNAIILYLHDMYG